MSPTFTVLGYLAAFLSPGLCCLSREYEAMDGQCCPMCREGTYVRKDCTAESGTGCRPCENNTFMNQPNGLNRCFPCTSCDQGLFVQRVCTATADTVCDVMTGYFCKALMDDTGCSLAQKHTCCSAGYRTKVPGTSRTDTVCESCQMGYFSLDGLSCTLWTICSESQVKLQEGDRDRDVVCGLDSRHHYFLIPVLLSFSLTLVALVITGSKLSAKKSSTSGQSEFSVDSRVMSQLHTEKDSPG